MTVAPKIASPVTRRVYVTKTTSTSTVWPSSIPTALKDELLKLTLANELHGLNPKVLAGIANVESNFTPGLNGTGYGGYFGEGSRTTGKGTLTTSQLLTKSVTSFSLQAKHAASLLSLLGAGSTPVRSINSYVNGPNSSAGQSSNPATSSDASYVVSSILKPLATNSQTTVSLEAQWWQFLSPGADIATGISGGALAPKGTGVATQIPGLSGLAAVGRFFSWVGSGYGLGWPAVFSIVLGLGLIFIGLALLGFNPLMEIASKVEGEAPWRNLPVT